MAEQGSKGAEEDANVDMSNLDASSFDMSALIDACKELSSNQDMEKKVKQTNLFMKHILNAYDEIVEEGPNGKEQISECFLKKLKKSKKREPSFKQNRRQLQSKDKHDNYNDKMNQKMLKKKRNTRSKGRMSIY